MTLKKEIKKNVKVIKNDSSKFNCPYSEEEKQVISNIFKGNRNVELFNGINVRLDGVINLNDISELYVSKTSFFDLISTNLLLFNYKKWINIVDDKDKKLIEREKELFDADGKPKNIDDLLTRNYLSNAMAVSVLIFDNNNNYLFAKRNGNVAISANIASVSVTGAIDDVDYLNDNPITSCVKRESFEELGLHISDEQISLRMIVAGEKKLQPIVLCDVLIDENLNDEIVKIMNSITFNNENSNLVVIKKPELLGFVNSNEFTEAAIEHVKLHTK